MWWVVALAMAPLFLVASVRAVEALGGMSGRVGNLSTHPEVAYLSLAVAGGYTGEGDAPVDEVAPCPVSVRPLPPIPVGGNGVVVRAEGVIGEKGGAAGGADGGHTHLISGRPGCAALIIKYPKKGITAPPVLEGV
jgi:hypothetical protein